MIDVETLSTAPDALILTIAAQSFDPLSNGYFDQKFYARIDFESQPSRKVEQSTIDWWATQKESRDEAFSEIERVPLDYALKELGKLIWKSSRIWANGANFDMNILEHAYKSYNMKIPWQYYHVRDARTVYSLYPGLPKPPIAHHALLDCRRQIEMLQQTLKYLNITTLN